MRMRSTRKMVINHSQDLSDIITAEARAILSEEVMDAANGTSTVKRLQAHGRTSTIKRLQAHAGRH